MIWTAFTIGLIGSLHCAGMCGPLAMMAPLSSPNPRHTTAARLAYNLGRILTYTLLGALVGAVGQAVAWAGVQRWISIATGILVVAAFASSKPFFLTPTASLGVGRLKGIFSVLLKQRSIGSVFALGTLNGLLPCGLVYVACSASATTAHPFLGMAYMAAFGLGTLPMMLAITFSGQAIPPRIRFRLQRLIPLCGLTVGALLIVRGLSLGIPYISPDLAQNPAACHTTK